MKQVQARGVITDYNLYMLSFWFGNGTLCSYTQSDGKSLPIVLFVWLKWKNIEIDLKN